MSSGTHFRHLCYMGDPRPRLTHSSSGFEMVRTASGAAIEPFDRPLQLNHFAMHCPRRLLDRTLPANSFFGAQPEVEQPGSSVLVFVPYIQHIATALNDKLGFKRLRPGRPGRRLDTELDGSLRTRGPQTVLASRYPVRPSGVIVFAL